MSYFFFLAASEDENEELFLDPEGDLSDDPRFSPSESESNTSEESKPKKRKFKSSAGKSSRKRSYDTEASTSRTEAANARPGAATTHPEASSYEETLEEGIEAVSEDLGIKWFDHSSRQMTFEFSLENGIPVEIVEELSTGTPFNFWEKFVTSDIFELMVVQTNLYMSQKVSTDVDDTPTTSTTTSSKNETNVKELKNFLGLILFMGIVKLPKLRYYWSTDSFFKNEVCSNTMSRNRFEQLLNSWHFSNNQECPEGDRLFKIDVLRKMLVENFQQMCVPGEVVCVDESMIPFRGRLHIRQYIPNKTHKYGIKVFKLCCGAGYTWNMKIYAGKEREEGASVPTNVVISLAENLLCQGRTIVTDNYYTSLELAEKLLEKQTHLLGTLRKNRKGLPIDVVQKKLKKNEITSKENEKGITILKWKDKRDVLMLSTKHADETASMDRRSGVIVKPQAVIDYNKGKSSIDLSDQMASYNTCLRRTLKWYRKIAIELLFGTAMVNAHILYKKITQKSIPITDFQISVAKELLKKESTDVADKGIPKPKKTHCLEKKEGESHKVRRDCVGCSEKKSKKIILKSKVKKVITFCSVCPEKPHYCIPCFAEKHKKL